MNRGRFFVSHNAADKDYARALATRIRMSGCSTNAGQCALSVRCSAVSSGWRRA